MLGFPGSGAEKPRCHRAARFLRNAIPQARGFSFSSFWYMSISSVRTETL